MKGKFFLGHDGMQYETSVMWLRARRNHLLVHCKDYESIAAAQMSECHYFCHFEDAVALTSREMIWVHDVWNVIPDSRCIVPLISRPDVIRYENLAMSGVCSDWPALCKDRFRS